MAILPPDVIDKPYENAVSALVEKNIITGDVDGNFYPDSNLTRAQFCTIIVKAMRTSGASVDDSDIQDGKTATFPDLAGYGWAEGYISYAVEKGVVKGYPDGSFKPGNNVSMFELITMTLRAAGYPDNLLPGDWPENYVDKAVELNALTGLSMDSPEAATKWNAAQFVYNMLEAIEKANQTGEADQANEANLKEKDDPSEALVNPGTSVQETETTPASIGLTYINKGSFDKEILTFAGKNLSPDVEVLIYKLRADYKKDMQLSEKEEDYIKGDINKYSNVETPAWYLLENNVITRIILPNNVGFTGLVYCVINNINRVSDVEFEVASKLYTITAGKNIDWITNADRTYTCPDKSEYLNGCLFELKLRNGRVTGIAALDDSFGKVSGSASGSKEFKQILEKSKTGIRTETSSLIYDENLAVYLFDKKNGNYSVLSKGNYYVGSYVRIFHITDGKESLDVIIVEG
jgi:hypothetical protein